MIFPICPSVAIHTVRAYHCKPPALVSTYIFIISEVGLFVKWQCGQYQGNITRIEGKFRGCQEKTTRAETPRAEWYLGLRH